MKSGVLLAAEGLHASSKGARIRFSGDKRTVIDGPRALEDLISRARALDMDEVRRKRAARRETA